MALRGVVVSCWKWPLFATAFLLRWYWHRQFLCHVLVRSNRFKQHVANLELAIDICEFSIPDNPFMD